MINKVCNINVPQIIFNLKNINFLSSINKIEENNIKSKVNKVIKYIELKHLFQPNYRSNHHSINTVYTISNE